MTRADALTNAPELLRVTLAGIRDAVITTDADGCVTFLNGVAETLTGWSPADAAGRSLADVFRIVDEASRVPVENPAPRAVATGAIVAAATPTVLVARDGSEHAIEHSVTPVRSDSGAVIAGVVVFRDVTAARDAARMLQESEAFSRSVFESSPDCVKILDPEGRLLDMNTNGLCLMEIDDLPALRGRAWDSLWPEDARARVLEALAAARREGRATFEAACPTAKGTRKWWSVAVAPVRNAQGELRNYVSVSRDMTERRAMTEALAANEERFRMLADNMSQFAFTADADGRISWYNQRWYDYTGTTLQQMRGWGWTSVLHPEHVDRVVAGLLRSQTTGEVWEDTFPLRGKDGEYRWYLSRAVQIRDEQGKLARWFGTNTDVTDQRESAEKLRVLAAELSEADRRKNEFLAMLAHEFRNPLAPIRNAVQIVRRADDDGERSRQASAIIERQIVHLVRLVDDLLDVSRVSRGTLDLRPERVEVAAIVRQAVETLTPAIEAARHRLTVTLPPAPVLLHADPVRLAQVLGNLLNNACKYSDPGASIALTVAVERGEVVVAVADTGIGIAAEMLPRIFDMFSQVDRSLERSQGGLGIGLTLVKRIVELHAGSVVVASAGIGQGSEFVVRLPVLVDGEDRAATEAPAAPAAPVSSAPLRILVVDDNRDAAESLAMLLDVVGNVTALAFDGEAAVAVAAEFRPDVLLLDIGLPGLNGYEVALAIRAQPWGGTIKLIALTGWGQDEDRHKSSAAGFDAHLVKPVDFDALQRLLAS